MKKFLKKLIPFKNKFIKSRVVRGWTGDFSTFGILYDENNKFLEIYIDSRNIYTNLDTFTGRWVTYKKIWDFYDEFESTQYSSFNYEKIYTNGKLHNINYQPCKICADGYVEFYINDVKICELRIPLPQENNFKKINYKKYLKGAASMGNPKCKKYLEMCKILQREENIGTRNDKIHILMN